MDTAHAKAVAEDATQRLASSLQHMVNEAEHLLSTAARSGDEHFNAARDKFEQQLRQAKNELRDLQGSAVESARRAARVTDHAVHDHPYAAMGIAGGVGLLVGMLISRR
jgi:ElaB/YqjD/DUF883 family membrane-anchored ribosome-binding protein